MRSEPIDKIRRGCVFIPADEGRVGKGGGGGRGIYATDRVTCRNYKNKIFKKAS